RHATNGGPRNQKQFASRPRICRSNIADWTALCCQFGRSSIHSAGKNGGRRLRQISLAISQRSEHVVPTGSRDALATWQLRFLSSITSQLIFRLKRDSFSNEPSETCARSPRAMPRSSGGAALI